MLFIDTLILFCMFMILFKLCCSWSYFVGMQANTLEKIICDVELFHQATRSMILGFLLSLSVPTFATIVLFVFVLSPPPSLAFLFSSVYVVLPSSMPFTHFVSIPLLFCGYHFCFCFLNVWKGMRLFKNTVDATRRVRSSWANVMEVCVSWIGVNCERGHGLISSSLSFMFFWRIVQFLNVSCKWPLLRLFK